MALEILTWITVLLTICMSGFFVLLVYVGTRTLWADYKAKRRHYDRLACDPRYAKDQR